MSQISKEINKELRGPSLIILASNVFRFLQWGYDDGTQHWGGVYEEGEIRAREEEISRDMERMGRGHRTWGMNIVHKVGGVLSVPDTIEA